MANPPNIGSRRKTRRLVMQALYLWHFTHHELDVVLREFMDEHDMNNIDLVYFKKLVTGAITSINILDDHIKPFLDRPIEKLNPVELAILRLAAYEFLECLDVPYKVVINEALELSKKYGSEQGYKYVNGVLDKLALQLRSSEANL